MERRHKIVFQLIGALALGTFVFGVVVIARGLGQKPKPEVKAENGTNIVTAPSGEKLPNAMPH